MFYGWKLAGIGSFGNFMLSGGILYVMNAFIEPLTLLYGWSRAGMGISMSVASMCATLSMPVAIATATRFGIRKTMTAGALLGGLAIVGMGYTPHLWVFSLLFSVVWSSGQMCGGSVANMLAGNWFVRFRGRGFGIVNVGMSLSGAILPFVALLLVDALGVRAAYTLLGVLVLLFCPICWLMVRDVPADLGLYPDGDTGPQVGAKSRGKQVAVPRAAFFRDRKAWIAGLSFGAAILCTAGVVGQLKPRFVEIGLSSYPAMACMCLTALFGAGGKLFWGWLSDRLTPLRTAKLLLLGNIIGMAFILLPAHPVSVAAFVICYGLCMGGLWTMYPSIIAYLFGADRFYSAYKYASVFVIIKAFGYAMTGISFTLLHSYTPAYIVMILLMCIGFGFICSIRECDAAEYIPPTQRSAGK